MPGRHQTMDKPSQEPRPYCMKHKIFFRNWAGAFAHRAKHPGGGCRLVTKLYKTR